MSPNSQCRSRLFSREQRLTLASLRWSLIPVDVKKFFRYAFDVSEPSIHHTHTDFQCGDPRVRRAHVAQCRVLRIAFLRNHVSRSTVRYRPRSRLMPQRRSGTQSRSLCFDSRCLTQSRRGYSRSRSTAPHSRPDTSTMIPETRPKSMRLIRLSFHREAWNL